MLLPLAIITVTFGLGLAITAYASFAEQKGWPVSAAYSTGISIPQLFGIMAVLAAPIFAFVALPWWSVFVVLVGGVVIGLVTTRVFRSATQIVAPVVLLGCWVFDLMYVLP